MDKKSLFGLLSIISLILMLFTPTDSNAWKYFLVLGVVFGIGWWVSK